MRLPFQARPLADRRTHRPAVRPPVRPSKPLDDRLRRRRPDVEAVRDEVVALGLAQPFQALSKFASRRVETFVAVATCLRSGFEADVSPLYAPWRHASPELLGPPNCLNPEGWISGL